eukprot:4265132-Prymnesium_polylepis.2
MAILGSRILARPSTAIACERSTVASVEAALDLLAGVRASVRTRWNHGCFVSPSGAMIVCVERSAHHAWKRGCVAAIDPKSVFSSPGSRRAAPLEATLTSSCSTRSSAPAALYTDQ